ncbi:MAG: hypothetical protein WD872_09575 [Pirellulaceae bacterium]
MIRLGFCFDLLDPYNVKYLQQFHGEYIGIEQTAGRKIVKNANKHKYLDCAVFQFAFAAIEGDSQRVDSARAVYVPKGNGQRVWKRSWISSDAHIQLCVRNPSCILGTWLHHPMNVENGNEPNQAPPDDFQPEDQAGGQKPQAVIDIPADPTLGDRKVDDPG